MPNAARINRNPQRFVMTVIKKPIHALGVGGGVEGGQF